VEVTAPAEHEHVLLHALEEVVDQADPGELVQRVRRLEGLAREQLIFFCCFLVFGKIIKIFKYHI
jgi:hypothetical protein